MSKRLHSIPPACSCFFVRNFIVNMKYCSKHITLTNNTLQDIESQGINCCYPPLTFHVCVPFLFPWSIWFELF